ncbi:hypothetical protein B0T14DRAFT_566090 [Immersiella caudata]|uniref:Uncharacterized protein n=1 Tax=Immersiella caudata TaxID=314043 RepID=A0AA39WPI1_9PEZI|nr:hypothetical protein B0T14DRAFT_566090 [Immersiella caudata]
MAPLVSEGPLYVSDEQIFEDGIAKFDTFFPGQYNNRAVHIYAMIFLDAKRQPNGNIAGGGVAHIGQLYFDKALINEVEKLPPYTTNTQNLTLNADDGRLLDFVAKLDPAHKGVVAESVSWSIIPAAWKDENGGHQDLIGPMGNESKPPKIPPNPIP